MDLSGKSLSVSELKARLSESLRLVKAGEQILVTEHGRPIAVLGPSRDTEGELANLAAAGLIRLGSDRLPADFWDLLQPKDAAATVRSAVREEREEGESRKVPLISTLIQPRKTRRSRPATRRSRPRSAFAPGGRR